MASAQPAFIAMVTIISCTLIVGTVYVPVWAIHHHYLPSRLDGRLFKQPFFQPSELNNYRFFPLSLLRSLNYIFLIGWPSLARRRRFRGLSEEIKVSRWATVLCRVQVGLIILGLALALAFFGWGGFMTLFVLNRGQQTTVLPNKIRLASSKRKQSRYRTWRT